MLYGNKKILDIGCGIGLAAIAFRQFGNTVFGVDKFVFPNEMNNMYSIEFEGNNLPNGIYICKLTTEIGIYHQKLILVK